MPSAFTVRSVVREQLVMNDGHAQETLKELAAVMATTGAIFQQGSGDAQRGVIIRALTEAEIKAMKVSMPHGLLLPAPLTAADVQDFAEQHFDVVKLRKLPNSGKYEARPADFRAELAHRFIKARLMALRPLCGVAYTPIIRSDGTIVTTPGYDAATQLWIVDAVPKLSVPQTPGRRDAEGALGCLRALVTEHPFEQEADRVAGVAQLMAPALRASMERAPMLVTDANYARTGKDYLVGTASLIGTGFRPTVFTLNEAREEQQKRIGSALLLGAPMISLNNINGRLASDELAAYLTEGGCITRAYATVGGAKWAPNGNTIVASGNNIMLAGDLPERSVTSRQDAHMEFPGERKFNGSPHKDVLGDRGKYLSAVFTIALWAVRGTDYTSPSEMAGSGGFDDFNRLIRGPLLALTGVDPLKRARGEMQTARQHQPDRDLVDALTSLIEHKAAKVKADEPFCVRDIQAELKRHHVGQDEADPWAVLRHKDLPYRLRRARGRRGATMQFVSIERPSNGADVAWYKLVPLDDVREDGSPIGLRTSSDSPYRQPSNSDDEFRKYLRGNSVKPRSPKPETGGNQPIPDTGAEL